MSTNGTNNKIIDQLNSTIDFNDISEEIYKQNSKEMKLDDGRSRE